MESVLNIQNVKKAYLEGKENNFDFNCWGATLYSLGYSKRLRWVNGDEMIEWLDENTFVVPMDYLQIGDILVLWRGEDRNDFTYPLEHTAVYLGKGKYFHKRGSSCSEIATLEDVRAIYWQGEFAEIRRLKKRNI